MNIVKHDPKPDPNLTRYIDMILFYFLLNKK